MNPDFLTLEDIAKEYHLSKSYLYKRTSSKAIPYYRVGKLIMFNREEFAEWFEKTCRVEAV